MEESQYSSTPSYSRHRFCKLPPLCVNRSFLTALVHLIRLLAEWMSPTTGQDDEEKKRTFTVCLETNLIVRLSRP